MNLAFSHRGRQFFFITVGLLGRPAVLSQIVAGEKRPLLSWLGEAVKAGFLALHKVYPALTASDAVVMPDHFHLLLIVNYAVSPSLDPLWVCQRLLEAIEAAWALAPDPPAHRRPRAPRFSPPHRRAARRPRPRHQ